MDSVDKDLRALLRIRQMRTDSLNRAARQREMERNAAARDVEEKVQGLGGTETEVRQTQREYLNGLLDQGFVKMHRVEAFSRMQLKGVKRIMDANRDIELAQKQLERSAELLEESLKLARAAEKRKIAIQEAIEWRKK